jgi:hypothetical protein
MAATTVANILTAVGYRVFLDASPISATSEPSQAECIQWINETCQELLTVCVEWGSEIGRTTGSITLADGTASYNTLLSLLFSTAIFYDQEGKQFSGWIEKTNVRNPLKLGVESDLLDLDPAGESEPDSFYIDGSNNLIFMPTPDATYTAKIPYYPYHTVLTATGDTVPFVKVFDTVITESVVMRAQNRAEYDLSFELKWFSYIRQQGRKIISMRKNPTVAIHLN